MFDVFVFRKFINYSTIAMKLRRHSHSYRLDINHKYFSNFPDELESINYMCAVACLLLKIIQNKTNQTKPTQESSCVLTLYKKISLGK